MSLQNSPFFRAEPRTCDQTVQVWKMIEESQCECLACDGCVIVLGQWAGEGRCRRNVLGSFFDWKWETWKEICLRERMKGAGETTEG